MVAYIISIPWEVVSHLSVQSLDVVNHGLGTQLYVIAEEYDSALVS